MTIGPVHLREATVHDAEALARLAAQLGYPTEPAQMARRLQGLPMDATAVIVATAADEVIGWIHVHLYPTLLDDQAAEILGFVVDEDWRSRGVGHTLMESAEAWAKERGCTVLYVRTNVVRQRAQGFYLAHGFQKLKTSYTLVKSLSLAGAQN